MANPDNPHGFGPLNRSLAGGPGAATFECHKLAATAAIFIGDAVVRVAAPTRKTPAIGPATPAGVVFGVNLVYGPATTATDKHLVIPSGNLQMFEIQDNDDVTGMVAGNITKNANFATGAGSAATQLSGTELDIATVAATNTLGMRMHGLLNVPNNDFGPHARVIVTFNRNEEMDQTAGVLDVVVEEEEVAVSTGGHRGKHKEEGAEEEAPHNAVTRGRK